MQLRSGKTTMSIDTFRDMRFYGKIHRGNITMTMKPYTKSGKKTKPIIDKHPMTLRSRKQPETVTEHEDETQHEPLHFADMISMRTAPYKTNPFFETWLIGRLRRFLTSFDQITGGDYNKRIIERSRLFGEITAVLSEHIDYITTSPTFAKFTPVLYSKLFSFKTELTMLLNGQRLPGAVNNCNFTHHERAILGNVRADIVKLAVIMKPPLPVLPIV